MNIKKKISTSNIQFPDPRILPEESDGLLYIGGNLEPDTLLRAYSSGIFPWPLEAEYPLFWFCPQPRGVLDFDKIHIPKSLAKIRKKNTYRFTFNTAFRRVMEECAKQSRPGQQGTWIVPDMFPAYEKFHQMGHAHSIECWREDNLVGGLYGVYVKGVFCGESMFHLEDNTSKLALLEIALKLKSLGLEWMDIQMLTPVTEALGGIYINRKDFLDRLDKAKAKKPPEKITL